jgi:hypothetical protein
MNHTPTIIQRPPKTKKSTAFLKRRVPVGEQAVRWAWRVTRDMPDAQRRVWLHALASQCMKGHHEPEGWVPMPWPVRRNGARGSDLERLVQAGWLEVWRYSRVKHRCTRLRIPEHLLAEYDEALDRDHPDAPRWNLMDAKPVGTARYQTRDGSRNMLPRLIRQAIDAIAPHGHFNIPAATEHVQRLREHAEATGDERDMARWRNDHLCLGAIMAQKPIINSRGIGRFTTPYQVATTGRLVFLNGGSMSCSGAMKAAGYSGIPGLMNYDIKSSQAVILRDLLAEDGIDTTWIDAYLQADKSVYAEQAGLPVKAWKGAVYALLMGGHLRKPERAEDLLAKILDAEEQAQPGPEMPRVPSIAQIVLRAHGTEGFADGYDRLYQVVEPLAQTMKAWHEKLIERARRRERSRSQRYAPPNDVGMPFCLDGLTRWQIGAQYAAHLLQGREAFWIDSLATMGSKHGFLPIAHEHDGLVTIGEITPEAIQESNATTGIHSLRLIPKSFA